eukprot:TRINITY_DN51314_c0_g1_i1.p1 TRINITY_DN51314_c0_g1~~TRINITY_DN51314_c0_g1_i1.p1  ORF type:complete len:296 (+),score=47.83 TRINITY_DN51314_c0_g1_i1:110-997(+)
MNPGGGPPLGGAAAANGAGGAQPTSPADVQPQKGHINVLPTELFYFLPPDGAPDKQRSKVGRTWDATPVAILAVSNPTEVAIPRVKVRVNHLDFLVRPPRFTLNKQTDFVPLLVRLAPGHDEVKMQLVSDDVSDVARPGSRDPALETRLVLRRVPDAGGLRAGVAMSLARRGDLRVPVFHAKELCEDQVRVALENTGVHSVAADFLVRGWTFQKLCGWVWGCCLRGKPLPGSFGFKHTSECPILRFRGKVTLTEVGQSERICPCCGGTRDHTKEGPGGLPYMLINIIIHFIDPLV